MSNQPLNPTAMFNKAISRGDAKEAWRWAEQILWVSLDRALSLTVALGVADDPRYRKAADRFLERYKAEAHPTSDDVAAAEKRLGRLGRTGPPPLKYGAGEELRELAELLAGGRV